jgi:transposase
VAVRRDEAEYQALRAEQQTEPWKAEYRARATIEHKISELKRHGLRRARYIGLVKTELQLSFTAAMVHLKRLAVLCRGCSVPLTA